MTVIHPNQLPSYLQAKSLKPIYLIVSEVPLLMQETRDLLRQTLHAIGFQQREVHYVESNFSWPNFFINLQHYNLFSNNTLIEVNNPSAKFDSKVSESLFAYVQAPATDKILLFITEKLTSAQQKSRWYKAIDQYGVIIQIRAIPKAQLADWIIKRAQQFNLKLTTNSVRMLAEWTEGNLLATQQALIKLTLLYPNQLIDVEHLTPVISNDTRFNVFDLSHSLLAGETHTALQCLRVLRDTGTEATLILWAICRDIRELGHIYQQQHQGTPLSTLLQRHWQQRRPLLKQAITRLSPEKINQLLILAAQVDRTIKGCQLGNSWTLLEKLVTHITTSQAYA